MPTKTTKAAKRRRGAKPTKRANRAAKTKARAHRAAKTDAPEPRKSTPKSAKPSARANKPATTAKKPGAIARITASVGKFFTRIAAIAEAEDHHPDLHLTGYRDIVVEIWTHALGGLSENDFILAAKIDKLPVELKV